MKNVKIRRETEQDFYLVEALIKRAFWNVHEPGCNEHYLAHTMRKHPDFIPELSLIIEDESGKVIGTVMYTVSHLMDEAGNQKEILTFGPVAIEPVCQRIGYGKLLLEESFMIAKELGYDTIVIFGNPGNYVGHGFKSCQKYNVCLEGEHYPAAMLVKELQENVLDGRKWFYEESPVYKIDMVGYENFDRNHEQMKPGYRPSHEEFYIHSHSIIRET